MSLTLPPIPAQGVTQAQVIAALDTANGVTADLPEPRLHLGNAATIEAVRVVLAAIRSGLLTVDTAVDAIAGTTLPALTAALAEKADAAAVSSLTQSLQTITEQLPDFARVGQIPSTPNEVGADPAGAAQAVRNLLTGYATTTALSDGLAGKINVSTYNTKVSALEATDTAQATAIAGKYTKPTGGIPESDLVQAVRDKLAGGGTSGSVPFVVFTGGDPSGSGDSTSALQAAVNAALTANLELVLPPGTFTCSAAITAAFPAVRIRGAGVGVTILNFTTSSVNLLSVGDGGGAQVRPTGWLRDLTVRGPSAAPTSGKAGVVINGLNQFSVENVQVENQDFGFDLVNNCYGTQLLNVRAGFGGSVNVGLNLRTGPQSGSDISLYNPWLVGRVAAVHCSPDGGGYHVFGGQLGCNPDGPGSDDRGAVILGKDYLTGATGQSQIDLHGVSFEGTNYGWVIRGYGQVDASFTSCQFNPANSSSPAIGAVKLTGAQNSRVQLTGTAISGHWSGTSLMAVAGAFDDLSIVEIGTYNASQRPRIAGVETFIASMLAQAQLLARGTVISPNRLVVHGAHLRSAAGVLQTSTDGATWRTAASVLSLTQAAYDALTVKDPSTLYLIGG